MSEPRTINLPGSGTDTQQYELAPGLLQYVQAVRVTIDNTAGADTHPILSVAEQSGVVIADAPQNGTIPAGEADAASTWALRLLDESTGGTAGADQIGFYDLDVTSVTGGNTTPLPFTYSFGDALLDLTTPTRPIFLANGTYIIRASCVVQVGAGGAGKTAMMRLAMQHNYGTQLTVAGNAVPLDGGVSPLSLSASMPWIVSSVTDFEVAVEQDSGLTRVWFGAVNVLKVGG